MLTEAPEKPEASDKAAQAEQEWARYKGLDYLIARYQARQEEIARDAGAPNHNVYEERFGQPNFSAVPHIMFFYYVRIDNDGRLRVVHYRYVDGDIEDPLTWKPIEYSEARLKPLVQTLAKNARPSGAKIPAPDPRENFEDIEWNRKSYISIFIDEANWSFHKFPSEDPAVVFITELKNGRIGTENHSFFDAMDFEIDMPIFKPKPGGPTSDKRSAIVFINHMKRDEIGTDLGKDEKEFFQFEMFVDVAFASGESVPMTVIFDPGGTNMGPPVPPPV